jgi:hypothetical protein
MHWHIASQVSKALYCTMNQIKVTIFGSQKKSHHIRDRLVRKSAEVLVLRDRIGQHLVGLNMRRSTSLRVLGLTCLTRGLVR